MSRRVQRRRQGLFAGTAALLVLFLACSTDSPTEPTQVPPPGPGPAPNAWVITVTVEPDQLIVGAEDPALVSVRVESRDAPGTFPPNGTTMVISTSIGELGDAGSGVQAVVGVIDRGRTGTFLFAGGFAGTGTVSAQLQGSVGRRTVNVINEAEPPFILGVSPSTGPAAGGTRVTISGTNFVPPLRVIFQTKLAALVSASTTQIVVNTPPGDIETEECDDNGDGVNGSRQEDTPVTVSVENSSGTSETLPNAFTYTVPNAGVCVGD